MKNQEHIDEAEAIGADSYELMNFMQLPSNASKRRQVEALNIDKHWISNHCDVIKSRIDQLISDIEG